MVPLLPSTPTYSILCKKLISLCYRDTFLGLSSMPFVSQANFLNHLSLKMERNLQVPQVLQSPHAMKCPILKVELAGFKEAKYALEQ